MSFCRPRKVATEEATRKAASWIRKPWLPLDEDYLPSAIFQYGVEGRLGDVLQHGDGHPCVVLLNWMFLCRVEVKIWSWAFPAELNELVVGMSLARSGGEMLIRSRKIAFVEGLEVGGD